VEAMLETSPKGHILLNGVEIEDTFAEICHDNEIVDSVLGENPSFLL